MLKIVDKEKFPDIGDMDQEKCVRALRAVELEAYLSIINAFRAQGYLTKEKRKILHELQNMLSIPLQRHRVAIRKSMSDDHLNAIAYYIAGPDTKQEWMIEGRHMIPLLPRATPQFSFTPVATLMAERFIKDSKMLPMSGISQKRKFAEVEDLDETDSEEETEGLRYLPDYMVPPAYSKNCGAYTTLPLSEERCAKGKMKGKYVKLSKPEIEKNRRPVTPIAATKPLLQAHSSKRKKKLIPKPDPEEVEMQMRCSLPIVPHPVSSNIQHVKVQMPPKEINTITITPSITAPTTQVNQIKAVTNVYNAQHEPNSRFILNKAANTTVVPSNSQNLYVVNSSDGVMKVVSRTAAQSTMPVGKLVTVNAPISRTSPPLLVNTPQSTPKILKVSQVSPGQVRAVSNTTKNNVIVFQQSALQNNNLRTVVPAFKDNKLVKPTTATIVQNAGTTKINLNGNGHTKTGLPPMMIINHGTMPTKIIHPPATTPVNQTPSSVLSSVLTTITEPPRTVTEVAPRTISSNLIYIEPNFLGKKPSTVRTTLSFTPSTDGTVTSRPGDLICRVTPSGRSFNPLSSTSISKRPTILKEVHDSGRRTDIKENNGPIYVAQKKMEILNNGKLAPSSLNLLSSITKKPAILSNNFTFSKMTKRIIRDENIKVISATGHQERIEYAKGSRTSDPRREFGEDEMSVLGSNNRTTIVLNIT